MFSLEKVKQTVDTEELSNHLAVILDKLQFIVDNQEKLSLTPEVKHSINTLLQKTIPDIFDNYLSFPLEYRNKTSIHDGLTLKDLLAKQLIEITYQVNTIEKIAFQNNEILALAQLKQLESHSLHNNDFEKDNQSEISINNSFNYDSYIHAQKEQERIFKEEKIQKETKEQELVMAEAEKTHQEYKKMKEQYPYQFESADKYSKSSLDAMLAENITKFSNIDDINFESKYTIRIDPKNVHSISIEDVIRKNVINPKIKFTEKVSSPISIVTPKAEFYQPAVMSSPSVGVLTLPNGSVMSTAIPTVSTDLVVREGKNLLKAFGVIATCALFSLLLWGAFTKPHKDHTQEYAIADAHKAEMVSKLNSQFGSVTKHYRGSETGKEYTVIFQGFDPIILQSANVSVVGSAYHQNNNSHYTMIHYNGQYYDVTTGSEEDADGFDVQSVTDNVVILQRYKPSF